MTEDLRTGIANAEYKVGFEIDDFDLAAREGWSVLIQGSAHHVDSGPERAAALEAGVEPWPGGGAENSSSVSSRPGSPGGASAGPETSTGDVGGVRLIEHARRTACW